MAYLYGVRRCGVVELVMFIERVITKHVNSMTFLFVDDKDSTGGVALLRVFCSSLFFFQFHFICRCYCF